ncbi:MAG TPA: alpha/beta hydrolase [Deltaproteobacteria bacterium]|nr:alpha/beta hydrolase [Deltaproteobacteria bacterium]
MATLELGPQNSIYYEYAAPTSPEGCTFVFFNALTGSTDMWNAAIAPQLQKAGHGTLLFNFRGQANSTFAPGTRLNPQLISDDAQKLLKEIIPPKPVFVGLSIGGLFAAYTYLNGADASGLVFLNTLRRDGARLRWINDATVLYAKVGGMDLLKDCMFPLLFDEEWLAVNRKNFMTRETYEPIDRQSGHYFLLDHSRDGDWDIPYEKLDLPTLVVTGLADHVFYKEAHVSELFGRLPNAKRLDIPNAGHMIPVEKPEILIEAFLDFSKTV